jgi:regulatory protein
VRQELQAKGIAADAVAEAVSSLQSTELERARALWQRRFDAPPSDAKERARQARFLLARGFGGATVAKVLRTGGDDD